MKIRPRARVTEEQVYRDHGAGRGMRLACGHTADGIVRGSGGLYHCPVCSTAEESIYSVRARARHRKAGWAGVFRKLRARAKASPDAELGKFVARELVPLLEDLEGRGWGHGHRDGEGFCQSSGEDCPDCDRLVRVRAWVEGGARA